MFKIVSILFCCINFNIISSELASEVLVPEENPFTMPTDWTDIITSLDQDSFNNKQDKFSNLIKVIKTALCEELETISCNKIKENNQEPVTITCVDENNLNINSSAKTVEKDCKNTTRVELKKILARIASTTNKSKSKKPDNQPSLDVPTMIPIFKPKRNKTKTDTKSDFNKVIKETKANMSPNANAPAFTIPCQRTSDILDGSYLMPKITYETSITNPNPNVQSVKSSSQCEKPSSSLTSNSISCVESDDVIAMLFKPKTISIMQVYGNLLKKITITVLVPFYVSKLAL